MKKAMIICFITAISLILIGSVIIISVTANNRELIKRGGQYETNTYELKEAFESISIDTDIFDVALVPTEEKYCKVVCCESKKLNHSVAVRDKTLVIEKNDSRAWYEHIMLFTVSSPKITVYLPQTDYASLMIRSSTGDVDIPDNFGFESIDVTASTGDVRCRASASGGIKIHLSTGDIRLEGVNASELDLSASTGRIIVSSVTCEGEIKVGVSTGDARLTGVTCQRITSTGSTGDIFLENVTAAETIYLKRSTGDINFEKCDAAELFLNTSTGDIRGSLLSDKVFIAHSSSGNVNVPSTTSGGKCEADTNTGDIRITIKN